MIKIRFLLFFLFTALISEFFFLATPLSAKAGREDGRLNLLLITIDTLRSDRLSCYSPAHLETPNIDSLAQRGVLFTRAFAHTSTTLPSHANILLGATPLYHGVHGNSNFIVRDDFLTLAEHLKKFGYQTGAFVGSLILDARFGLSQGFDTYDDDFDIKAVEWEEKRERKAQVVVDKAMEWIKNRTSVWFLWIHCFDPHDPYDPPEPFKTQFKQRLYDGEVAYVDFVLGKLFSYLDEAAIMEKTLIVFTSDHGESLGEHGERTHGFLAYNAAIWVPLIIRVPGIKHRKVQQDVAHIDIFPTTCDVLKIKKPVFLQGVSLLSSLKGKKVPKSSLYFESLSPYYTLGWAPIIGFISGGVKFIDSPIPEAYDLKKDFEERNNIAESRSLGLYKKKLNEIILSQAQKENVKAERMMDRDTREKIESLGYIASFQDKKKEKYGPEDDVKVLLPYHYKSEDALDLCREGRIREGMEILKEVITEKKNISLAYINLALVYREQDRVNDAVEVTKLGLEHIPANYDIFLDYISYLFEAGRFDEVIQAFEKASFKQMEVDWVIWNYFGLSYSKTGNFGKAKDCYEKSISITNNIPIPYYNLGHLYSSLFRETQDEKNFQKAVENLKKAIDLDPDYSMAYYELGIAYLEAGNYHQAISNFEIAREMRPNFDEVLYYLGMANMKNGNHIMAYSYFNSFKATPSYHLLSLSKRQELETLLSMCKPRPQIK